MIDLGFLKGKTVAVMGLGIAGLATLRALATAKVDYLAWDDTEAARDKAAAEGFEITDYRDWGWRAIDEFVLSPGIPHTYPQPHPAAAAAREAGLRIISEIDLLGRAQCSATFVGITGTNGKSTTTALIGHILESAGRRIEVGGNLGPPVMAMAPLGEDGVYVIEMSSYALERTFSIGFDVALLLNISPDHLDRHGGLDGYVAAKERIFEGAKAAVVGTDDEISRSIAAKLKQAGLPVTEISTANSVETGITLPGDHNRQNATAARAACRLLGIDDETIAAAILSFPGLPHRQEIVGRDGEVVFVNDSKATNQDAAARALGSYARIFWIAGGQGKEGGYDALAPYLDRIAHAYLIGEAAGAIAAFLDGKVAVTLSGTLDAAVRDAYAAAANDNAPGEKVVLLSPACASFDQFANFGARGDRFREIVRQTTAGGAA